MITFPLQKIFSLHNTCLDCKRINSDLFDHYVFLAYHKFFELSGVDQLMLRLEDEAVRMFRSDFFVAVKVTVI